MKVYWKYRKNPTIFQSLIGIVKIEPCCDEIPIGLHMYYLDPPGPPEELGMAEQSSDWEYGYRFMKHCYRCGKKIEFIESKI